MEKKIGIYGIRCLANNKIYVGSSKSIKPRLYNHKTFLKRGNHGNQHLQAAWDKYGRESFEFSILELCTEDQLIEKETYWVALFDSTNKDKGFNKCLPGSYSDKGENVNENQTGIGLTPRVKKPVIAIYLPTGDIETYPSISDTARIHNLPHQKISDVCRYWKHLKGRRKRLGNWIFVRKEDYKSDFNYLTYKPTRKTGKRGPYNIVRKKIREN